ncbi:MAG: hypothetical protein WDA00_05275 [Eubacteriales bacterium]
MSDQSLTPESPLPLRPKVRLRERFSWFWEYYKWYALLALSLVAVLVLSTLQLCSRVSYDYTVLYAGPQYLGFEAKNTVAASFAEMARGGGDTAPSVELRVCHILTNEQAQQGGYSASYLQDQLSLFDNEIKVGDALILLLAPALFERIQAGSGALMPVSLYLPSGDVTVRFYEEDNPYAVYLSGTSFGTLPGLSELPDDTLLCLRTPVSLGTLFRQKKAEENHARYEQLFADLLAWQPTEED